MDIVIALALFAFAATLIAYTRATGDSTHSDAVAGYLPGDVPRKTPRPGARDLHPVNGALSSVPMPSWG